MSDTVLEQITAENEASEGLAIKPRAGATRPLRLLIIAPSLDILGGQAVQALRLYHPLRAEEQLEVSFLPINPRLPGLLGRLQAIKYVRTLLTWPYYVATLLARVHSYDVLHIFSASYLSFVLAPTMAILVGKLYGKKLVLNYHSGEAEDHLTRWERSVRPTLNLVDAIAVPSGYLVDVFQRFGYQAQAIFNTVETDRFRFRHRRPLRPVFLSNRNLEPLYNVECILRAFALIQDRYPEASLTVAGDGSQRVYLENLARELGLRHTTFLGRVPHGQMNELYDAADIYLNSSEIDNMPCSIIEAFASGLPTVTTDAGGIPYIVTHEETGLIVPRGDHQALAAAALRLLDDEVLAWKMARRAHSECAKYAWSAVRDQWLELYGRLTGRDLQLTAEPSLDSLLAQSVSAKRRIKD